MHKNSKIFKDESVVCIFHSQDFDGICSAEIVRHFFENCYQESCNIKFLGLNYGDEIPYKMLKNKVIICCDFYPLKFKQIIKDSIYSIYIDHHHSSILDMQDFKSDNFESIVSEEYSACKGVWKYFIDDNVPESIELLSKFDSFTFKEDEKDKCINFQYGMKSEGQSTAFDGELWQELFDKDNVELIQEIINKGKIINDYHKNHYDLIVAGRTGRDAVLDALDKTFRVIFINAPYSFSQAFDSIYKPSKHDIMMTGYVNNAGTWSYSFYCPKDKEIDVSLIAKSFDGGGHKAAAGCVSKDPII